MLISVFMLSIDVVTKDVRESFNTQFSYAIYIMFILDIFEAQGSTYMVPFPQ